MCIRDSLLGDLGDRLRQLHRAVDLGFPEFTNHVRTLESELAIAILSRYPTARAYRSVSAKKLARLCYDGRHEVGEQLARALVNTAKNSVGRHHSDTYRREIAYACEDIVALRGRLRELASDIKQKLEQHDLGKLLTTINGVGTQTAAYLIAELGDPARFHRLRHWRVTLASLPDCANPGNGDSLEPPSSVSGTRGCGSSGCQF